MGDVDELHAPVGHGDDALPQDAAAEDEVVVAQLVADRARLAGRIAIVHDQDADEDPARDPRPRLAPQQA